MPIDSLRYLAFLAAVVMATHALAASARRQNALLVLAGLLFYGSWDWWLPGLLLAYGGAAYAGARWVHRQPEGTRARRGALGVVVTALVAGLATWKVAPSAAVPIGLSFYCLQSVAYVVDVHRGMHEPERDLVTYLAFACLFPLLLAGPIERGRNVLPQLRAPRRAGGDDPRGALWLLVWGAYLKIVAADSIGAYVDLALDPSPHTTGWVVATGLVGYAAQVYFDFCGYSLLAKGSAGLLGVRVMWNFDRPYWSTSIQELWRRWHVSLSTWLRDYIFFPLGGAAHGAWREALHLVLTMIVAGLWHGTGTTFALWGAAQGIALAAQRLWARRAGGARMPDALGWALTMGFWVASMLLFRVPTLAAIGALLGACDRWAWTPFVSAAWGTLLLVGFPVVLIETLQARRRDLWAPARLRPGIYAVLVAGVLLAVAARYGGTTQHFIYFAF